MSADIHVIPTRFALATAHALMLYGYSVDTARGVVLGPMDDQPAAGSFLSPATYGPQGNIRRLLQRYTGHLVVNHDAHFRQQIRKDLAARSCNHEPPPDNAA